MSDLSTYILTHGNYVFVIILMMIGLYIVIARGNMLKKMLGLNIFQSSVFLLYISLGKVLGGTAPILTGESVTVYSNPLPHVLILTAIVVGVATTAVGYALIIRIHEAFGSIEDDDVLAEIQSDLKNEEGA